MKITRSAPAKINLTLEILGRRDDGYHDLRSVMQAISLHDDLTFEDDPSGALTLLGDTGVTDSPDQNLVVRAARLLQGATGTTRGARIHLKKWIPAGAGLGGGSSDAAATLLALDTLWSCRLPADELLRMGAELGSDVPFFMTEGTALAEGRGEKLTPLPPMPETWLVVSKPGAALPTAAVYAEYARQAQDAAQAVNHSALLVDALQRGDPLPHIGGLLWNDLQGPALRLCPEMDDVRDALDWEHSAGVLVSGSGSSLFALVHDSEAAITLAELLDVLGYWSEPCHTVRLYPEEAEWTI